MTRRITIQNAIKTGWRFDMTDDEFALRADMLANRLVLSLMLSAVARIANPSAPQDFVRQIEKAAEDQLPESTTISANLTAKQNARMRQLVLAGVREMAGRMNWADIGDTADWQSRDSN